MQLNEWTVIKNKHTNQTTICYGSIEEYIEETNVNATEIAIVEPEDWTTEHMIQITENLLEDVNKHSVCMMPTTIHNLMKKTGISSSEIKQFFKLYMNEMFETYGY